MAFTTDQITLITVCVTAAITLLVAIITAFVALRTNALSRKNDHKLSVLKVLLEAAYKEYEFRTKSEIEEALRTKKTAKIKSFTEYIIFYREMAEIFSNDIVSRNDIVKSLEKNKVLIDAYYDNIEKQRPEYHKEIEDMIKANT